MTTIVCSFIRILKSIVAMNLTKLVDSAGYSTAIDKTGDFHSISESGGVWVVWRFRR